MYMIGQHINGICLNPIEYALKEEGGEVMKFNSKDEAIQWLKDNSENPECVQEDIDNCAILIVKEEGLC